MATAPNRIQANEGREDPDLVLPRAVREAARRSEELAKEAGLAPADPPNPVVAPETPPPPVAEVPVVPPSEPPPQEPQDWEHRYKTLQGRAEADRKRARDAIEQLTQRVDQ